MPKSKPNFSFTLILALFSGCVLSGGFLLQGSLYWDTSRIFPQFRDNLHALNYFQEFAWWLPHNQMGSPGYYHSILGIPSCFTPAFAMVAGFCYLLGLCKIHIQNYQPLYVLYFGFLIPILFLFAIRKLANILFNNPQVIRYVLFLAAFSPGLTFNLSDVGYLESSIYSLFFAGSYLAHLKFKSKESFWILGLSIAGLGLSLNHAFLYFNLFFIPFLLILVRFWNREARVGKQFTFKQISIVTTLFLICASPNLIVQTQGSELVRSSLGMTKLYPVEKLAAGNPLESLLVSTPGFGFDWDSTRSHWTLMPLSNSYHAAHYYLGLLCLPLALYGLLFGTRILRLSLFILGIFYFGVLSLSAYSPFMAPLMSLHTPLRSCNHFSDAAFKAGSYLILIFMAAFGLQTLLRTQRIRIFTILFLISSLFSVITHIWLNKTEVAGNISFGILLFSIPTILVLLFWNFSSKHARTKKASLNLLILFTFLDVSTHAFLWVRTILDSKVIQNSGWGAISRMDETWSADKIGLRNATDRHFYANTLLILKPYFELLMQKFNPYSLPPFEFYTHVHPNQSMPQEIELLAKPTLRASRSLAIDKAALSDPKFTPFLKNLATEPTRAQISILKRSYSSLRLEVLSNQPAVLFIRDAYSPYWSATLNGQPTSIARAFFNFKAIPIQTGTNALLLKFRPPYVLLSIFMAYGLVILLLGRLAWLRLKPIPLSPCLIPSPDPIIL